MNILIKLTSIVALIIAPHIAEIDGHDAAEKLETRKPQMETVSKTEAMPLP